ncbi:hypothetical protein MJW17_002188, partial [Neisseria gonorrhoeae]
SDIKGKYVQSVTVANGVVTDDTTGNGNEKIETKHLPSTCRDTSMTN